MLREAQLWATLHVPDIEAAIEFYEGKLGLPLVFREELVPGREEVAFAVTPNALVCVEEGQPTASQSTAIALDVEDVEATVADLRDRGLVPEDYDLPYLRTQDGIGMLGSMKAAWFADPGGNLIAIQHRSRVPAEAPLI